MMIPPPTPHSAASTPLAIPMRQQTAKDGSFIQQIPYASGDSGSGVGAFAKKAGFWDFRVLGERGYVHLSPVV
jgi:hypothetical protein